MKSLFYSNGKPYFTIGGQVHNSSSCTEDNLKNGWKAAEQLGLNTIAIPVYWRLLEAEEGKFDFTQVDMVLNGAREHNLKLVILWFATWKNGASQYVPNWVKLQKDRFVWAETVQHNLTMTLSPHCENTREADKKAFCKLMEHLKEQHAEDVLLGIQVENEPGNLGTPRDYSETGEKVYRGQVPEKIVKWLSETDECEVKRIWEANGAPTTGSWETFFGKVHAAEICSAYGVSTYINEVSRAGKEIFNVPTYVNVWLGEMYNRVAGVDVPSGGATSRVIEMWKFLSPDIDGLCPDVYFNDALNHMDICRKYSIKNNPLYIPESGANTFNALNVLRAVAYHGLTGIHCFGIDSLLDENGDLKPQAEEYRHMVTILREMKPLIEKYHGTGKLYAVAQAEGESSQYFDFGDFVGRAVDFMANGDLHSDPDHGNLDKDHRDSSIFQVRAKGLIVYIGNGEFYLAGEGFRLNLIRQDTIEGMSSGVRASSFQNGRHQRYLDLEEGHFDEEGRFIVNKIRTGDECDTGLWVHSDIGVLHARLEV